MAPKANRTLLIITTAVLILSIGIFLLKKYYAPISREAMAKYRKEYVSQAFYGTIDSIYKYNSGKHIIDIIIKDTSGRKFTFERLSYSFQPLLVSFCAAGDSILKKANDENVTVIKKDGNYKTFVMY